MKAHLNGGAWAYAIGNDEDCEDGSEAGSDEDGGGKDDNAGGSDEDSS